MTLGLLFRNLGMRLGSRSVASSLSKPAPLSSPRFQQFQKFHHHQRYPFFHHQPKLINTNTINTINTRRRLDRTLSSPSFKKEQRKFYNSYRYNNGGISNDQVIMGLLGTNVAVFLLWKTANPYFMYKHFTLSPDGITKHYRFHTLVTSAFSHTDIWHLIVNMLGLYVFGGQVIGVLGARRFLSMYVGSGLLAGLAQVSDAYMKRRRTVLLGASGAVNSAVAFAVLEWPMRTIHVYGIIPVPLAIFGIFVMFQDVVGATSSNQGFSFSSNSTVGYVAHLCGAGVGAVVWAMSRGRVGRRF